MKETFLVVNPKSANGATGRNWEKLAAEARAALGDFDTGMTTRPMEAAELARKALREGARRIVAVGGDGTINEVVNGFFDGDAQVSPGAGLGVLPQGTGGDFRKTILVPPKMADAAKKLAAAQPRPADVGRIEFTDHAGQRAVRYFLNVASFGISGMVDREVNRSSKMLGGALSFQLASLRALLKYEDAKVKLSLDGGPAEELAVTCVAAANGRFFGGGMMVAPEAKIDDGIFHVTIWQGFGLWDFITKKGQIYNGTHVKLPGTRIATCKRMDAEASSSGAEVLIDVDGEQPGRLPASFTLLPGAIQVWA
jgi:YegS/Rv2252/BmrU family lipid kinase